MTTEAGKKGAGRAWSYPPRSEHPDTVVFVYQPWCKACGICYELCPAGVLTSDKAGCPVVSDPDACKACYLCEALCPEMAITVYRERGGGSAATSPSREDGSKPASGGEGEGEAGGDDG